MRNYSKTSVDYDNKEADIGEDSDEDEDNWKVEAEETDSDIYCSPTYGTRIHKAYRSSLAYPIT